MGGDAVPPLVELVAVSLSFGATRALDRVSLVVRPGEVLALLGENGAGKSTAMNLLFGLVVPDAGEIRIAGERALLRSPRDAREHGISMVHQHFTLVPGLTVLENFVLDEGGRSLLWVDRARALDRMGELTTELGMVIDPRARVESLSVGERQRLEILKALKSKAVRVLILDEPTANLTPGEVDDLFAVIRRLSAAGRGVVLITHKLREVLAVSDRVVVLRAGRVVAECAAAATSGRELARLMVGEESTGAVTAAAAVGEERVVAAALAPVGAAEDGRVGIETRCLVVAGARRDRAAVQGADLRARKGEIVGVAGVDGNGQSELAAALAGLVRPLGGEIEVAGRVEPALDPRRAAALGIACIPADRARIGLVAGLDLSENLILGHQRRPELGRGPLLDRATVRRRAGAVIADFAIRPPDPRGPASALSGGNQQRLVLARALAFSPRVIVAENPTRGLDVAATEQIHERLLAAARGGAAVIVFSTDLDEVLALATRIYVMADGRLTETSARDRAAIGLLMAGGAA